MQILGDQQQQQLEISCHFLNPREMSKEEITDIRQFIWTLWIEDKCPQRDH